MPRDHKSANHVHRDLKVSCNIQYKVTVVFFKVIQSRNAILNEILFQPENILLNDNMTIKLSDFGFPKS